jgi:membrane carboxypeptidase/penicillin-binding protein PbpC
MSPASRRRSPAYWRPDGEGFVRITAVDAEGRTATAEVRLK